MQFDLTILGSNGAVPAYGRHPTAQILQHNGNLYLIDCGEGTQLRMLQFGVKRARLNHIFISHLHGDHYFGLIGLLTSFNLNQREHPLHLFGPPGLDEILYLQFKHALTFLRYELIFHPVLADQPGLIHNSETMQVETLTMQHRIPTTGFIFREKPGLRRIIPEKLEQYQIPHQQILALKKGADFQMEDGSIIPNQELTLPGKSARSYAFCSDTLFHESLADQVKGVDLLYHEATFIEEHVERAKETLHSTARQAAQIALRAGVGKLLLGHFSARYPDLSTILQEAREVFPESYLAEEGKVFAMER